MKEQYFKIVFRNPDDAFPIGDKQLTAAVLKALADQGRLANPALDYGIFVIDATEEVETSNQENDRRKKELWKIRQAFRLIKGLAGGEE